MCVGFMCVCARACGVGVKMCIYIIYVEVCDGTCTCMYVHMCTKCGDGGCAGVCVCVHGASKQQRKRDNKDKNSSERTTV